MGLGAVLAGGCTVGAFFVPTLHASPSGFVMLVGLMIGAVIGLKLLMWTLEHISWGMSAPIPKPLSPMTLRIYPWLGLAVIVGILWWATSWQGSADEKLASRAIIILGGFAIGFVMHRSRFCVARAVREPFMTAEGDMTKAVILALAVGIPVASLIFQAELLDPYTAIPPRFWIGSLLGGIVFFAGLAECQRTPFDMAEAESELVAGAFTEYGGMGFGVFFMAEYANIVVGCCLATVLFFGGWQSPIGVLSDGAWGPLWFLLKTYGLIVSIIWIRWTFPRTQFYKLLNLSWKILIPVCLFTLLLTAATMKLPRLWDLLF
jgi:hypothetical protein